MIILFEVGSIKVMDKNYIERQKRFLKQSCLELSKYVGVSIEWNQGN